MATAGLSRAYAVLRQLDVLRTDDILHPVSLSASAPPHNGGPVSERIGGPRRSRRSVGTEGGVNSPSPVHLRSSTTSDHSPSAQGHRAYLDDAGARRTDAAHAPPPPRAQQQREGKEALRMAPPPSYRDVMSENHPDSISADTSFSSQPLRSDAQHNTYSAAPHHTGVASSEGRQHTSRPGAVSYWANASGLGKRESVATDREKAGLANEQHATISRGRYTDHVYLRHSPLSSPHRARVRSPVVLPAISASEADSILAHASSTLEDFFDKDDMPSVLASVAAAARDPNASHRHYSYHSALLSQTSAGNASTAVGEEVGGRLGRSSVPFPPPTTSTHAARSAGPSGPPSQSQAREQQQQQQRCTGRDERGSFHARQPASLTHSVERLVEAVESCVSHSSDRESETTDRPPHYPQGSAAVAAAAPPPPPPPLTYAPLQAREGRHVASLPDYAVSANDLDEGLSPIEARYSPTSLTHERHRFSSDLSSFYTAGRRSGLDQPRPRESAMPTPAVHVAHIRTHPIPAPVDACVTGEAVARDANRSSSSDKITPQETDARGTMQPSDEEETEEENAAHATPLTDENSREGSDKEGSSSAADVHGSDEASETTHENRGAHSTPALQAASRDGSEDSVDTPEDEYDGSDNFPSELTDALPFLDYVARVNTAPASVLLKELAAMEEAWSTAPASRHASATPFTTKERSSAGNAPAQRDEDAVVDCLALTLLLNKPAALRHITVPLLRRQLRRAFRTVRDVEDGNQGEDDGGRGRDTRVRSLPLSVLVFCDGGDDTEPAPSVETRFSELDRVLCAVIGLGSAAAPLLPLLLQLLLQLPLPFTTLCDVRLVGLAVRTSGAAEGLRALTRIVEERAEAPHVLAAAAYALSTYAYELPGHTSVMCIPAGTLLRSSRDGDDADVMFRLVPDPPKTPLSDVEESLRPLWSKASLPVLRCSSALGESPQFLHLPFSPPPYCPTHIVIDAEAALQSLRLYIASEVFRVRCDHPNVMVLLDDAMNASVLCAAMNAAAGERVYGPLWGRMRRDFHHALCAHQGEAGHEQSMGGAVVEGCLQLPLLLYSIPDFFTEERDMLFAVETALVHALVSRSPPLLQEQVLLTLCCLPPEARGHVVQPVTDFFLKVVRRYQLRHAATMRRASVGGREGGSASSMHRADDYGDVEGAAEEAVVVAAALAVGTVCVNPLAPSTCTSGCIAAVLPVLTELLQTSQWRVRHAACVGLAGVGPSIADPSSIVELFVSQLPTAAASSLAADTLLGARRLPVLQPATVVWCVARQQEGGVRALLRLLQNTHAPQPLHDWCAFQLASVDVHVACGEVRGSGATRESDALLDEVVQVLGRLVAMQGALEEDTVLWCVRALSEMVHRAGLPLADIAATSSVLPCLRPLQSPHKEQEAATYYQSVPLNSCFTVLTSVMEAALLPTNVLKALCLFLCHYGGPHGELYVCEMLLESPAVAARSAAAFGLRACGPTVVRSVVLGMNDGSFEVRREALDTMEALGAARVLAVLRHRPQEHRRQVLEALRDCLLQDAGRAVARRAADTVYRALVRQEQATAPLLLA